MHLLLFVVCINLLFPTDAFTALFHCTTQPCSLLSTTSIFRQNMESPIMDEIFPGGWESCQFVTKEEYPIIVAALYAPRYSVVTEQHNNKTATAMTSALGHQDFNFVDLLSVAPKGKNSEVDLRKLDAFVLSSSDVQNSWIGRILENVHDGCVVYVAGKTCIKVWERGVEDGKLGECKIVSGGLNVQRHTLLDGRVFSVLKAPHPSAHLLNPKLKVREEFAKTMHILNAIITDKDFNHKSLVNSMDSTMMRTEEHKQQVMKMLGVDDVNNLDSVFWGLPFHHQHVLDNFEQFAKTFGKSPLMLKLLGKFVGKMAIKGWVDVVVAVQKQLGLSKEQLVSFMGNSVASALNGPRPQEFMGQLKVLQEAFSMSKEQLVSFMCDSVAFALNGPRPQEFMGQLKVLQEAPFSLSKEQLVSFVCDSVASALNGPRRREFMGKLKSFLEVPSPFHPLYPCMSKEQLVSFMCDPVASAMGKNKDWFAYYIRIVQHVVNNGGYINDVIKMFGDGPHFHRCIAEVADALGSVNDLRAAVKALTVSYHKRDDAINALLKPSAPAAADEDDNHDTDDEGDEAATAMVTMTKKRKRKRAADEGVNYDVDDEGDAATATVTMTMTEKRKRKRGGKEGGVLAMV